MLDEEVGVEAFRTSGMGALAYPQPLPLATQIDVGIIVTNIASTGKIAERIVRCRFVVGIMYLIHPTSNAL